MDNSNSRYKKTPVANSDENVLREENDDERETVMQLQLFSALYIGSYKVQGMPVASINLNRPFLIDTTLHLQKKGHRILWYIRFNELPFIRIFTLCCKTKRGVGMLSHCAFLSGFKYETYLSYRIVSLQKYVDILSVTKD